MNTKYCTKCKTDKELNEFVLKKQGNKYYSWCKSCLNDYNRNRFKNRKNEILDALKIEKKCSICGYDKYVGALDFHHENDLDKSFNLSKNHSIKKSLKEAKKCVLVCANCHREIHAGLLI